MRSGDIRVERSGWLCQGAAGDPRRGRARARSPSAGRPRPAPRRAPSGRAARRPRAPGCPLQRHAAGVVADRPDRRDVLVGEPRSAGSAASSARLSSIGRASGAGLLDQGRDDARHRRVGEVPLAGELHRGQPGRSAIGRTRSSFSSPASIQPAGRKARWSRVGAAPCRAARRPRTGRRSRRPG